MDGQLIDATQSYLSTILQLSILIATASGFLLTYGDRASNAKWYINLIFLCALVFSLISISSIMLAYKRYFASVLKSYSKLDVSFLKSFEILDCVFWVMVVALLFTGIGVLIQYVIRRYFHD